VYLIKTILILAFFSALLSACGSQEDRAYEHTVRAQNLFEEGNYVTAKIEALNATQIEPRGLEARIILANIEEELKNYGAAMSHLQVAVASHPSNLDARLRLGNYYVLAEMKREASEQAEEALKLAPNSAEAHLLNGRVYYLKNEEIEAKEEVDVALQLDPTLVDAIIFKVGFQHNAGDWDGALKVVDEGIEAFGREEGQQLREFRVRLLRAAKRNDAVEADLKALMRDFPDNENYPLSLANFYSLAGRMDESEAMLRSVVAKYPNDYEHVIQLVAFIAERRGAEAAQVTLAEFIVKSPDELNLQLTLGRLHEMLDDQDAALDVYREIASRSPASEEGLAARNRIAVIKIGQGKMDEVRDTISEILADEKDNSDALLARAAFYISEGTYDDAIADLRIVLRSDEQSERALLLLARAHLGQGSIRLAQDAYRRLIEANPDHPSAANELAEILANSGDIEMAQDVLIERLKGHPDDSQAASSLVQALLFQGDFDAAEKAARKMVELGEPTGLAEYQLGQVLEAKESNQDALAAYKMALKKNSDAAPPLEGVVRILMSRDQTDEAIDYLNEHLTKHPTLMFPKYLLGSIYAQEGQVDTAERYLEEVIAGRPNSSLAYQTLASIHSNDLVRTIDIYRRGLDAIPDDENIGLLLATAYNNAGQYEKGISVYEKVLAINPENIRAINNLAASLLDHRSDAESHVEALRLAKRFESRSEPALLDTLGWAYYKNGDFKRARQYLESAIKPGNQHPLVHHHLGMAYFAEQELMSARRQLKKAIDLSDGNYSKVSEANETLDSIIDLMKPRQSNM
jgi:tetratricopeptide (TPR) repeat protein